MNYVPTIGLEIHAELRTNTKMFCDSKNDPDEKRPNVNICPVCMGEPGTLPVINKEAVRHVLRVGKAVGGTTADFTEFDRKNYFYPDIPKGYQISQYKYPLISGGSLNGIRLTRVHLEEDTARSIHVSNVNGQVSDASLIDFNRAGIPLMELVTEPVIASAKEAGDFARELQLLMRYLGASEANMEKGQMRVEANISLREIAELRGTNAEKRGNILHEPAILGTKVEVKNINSFRAVERAIEYEVKRQAELLESGGAVIQETRGWDETKGETFPQRMKEGSADYRYFPEPDLPKLKISEIAEFKDMELPELPWVKRARYKNDYDINDEAIEVFVANDLLSVFFEDAATALGGRTNEVKIASNYITSDIAGLLAKTGKPFQMNPDSFAELIKMAVVGEVSSRGAKDILTEMFQNGGDPRIIAKEKNLIQKSDEVELETIVEKIIAANADAVENYKKGKESALQFLVGQAMKESRGSANPKGLREIFEKKLR